MGDSDPTYMSYLPGSSKNLTDWSEPVALFTDYLGSDTNFAPFILSNGSVVAL